MNYPHTRTDDAEDSLAGVSFADPYRWLEAESEEVRQWQREQAKLASEYVREWPHYAQLRELVAHYATERRIDLPRFASGLWFRTYIADGASHARVLVSDEPFGSGRVLFDPVLFDPARPPFVSWISPSPDGQTLALGICTDGSESNTIQLIDVVSGELLAEPPSNVLMDSVAGGAQWLPDSSGFFFTAIAGAVKHFEQAVYLHRRLPTPTTVQMEIPWTTANDYRVVVVARDGQHAVALERINSPIPVSITRLGSGPLHWRAFVTSFGGTLAGHIVGGNYIAVTDAGASRGRLVAISLDAANPNDPQSWRELVGESEAVLRTVTPAGSVLYLTEFVDTYTRVRIVGLDGEPKGEVPLPGRGATAELLFSFGNLLPKGHPDKFLFGFSTLTTYWGIYCHVPGQEKLQTLEPPRLRLENTVVEDRWAVSADGTRVPYHIVRKADANDGPQPTLIYAYGGFNIPLVPQFPGMMAAFVAAGGAFVHAHLRGGGEFGLEWWRGGRHRNKQNTYDDLYAIAEDLIANRRCTPRTLALSGRSNGGLMAGVAVTQRPELWRAVIPCVPRLDLIGACRTAYGRRSTLDDRVQDLDNPEEVRRLASFSPYHLVREGVSYPAVFVDAGDTDPRCPPQDARKFVARLQRATCGTAPILLHVWENVGHGWATDRNTAIDECTEWLAFALSQLGVRSW